MKLRTNELRKLIKEYSRAIPEFAVVQIVDTCVEDVKKMMLNHIRSKSTSQAEQKKMIARLNPVLEDLEKELKEVIDEKVTRFLSET